MATSVNILDLQPGDIKPGDLITSDLLNWILLRLTNLEAATSGTGGPIVVPNLFGRTVADAKALLAQPAFQLQLGTVLDSFGAVVSPFAPDFLNRLVLGQSPPSGARVAASSAVALVVAATTSSGGTTPNLKPKLNTITPSTQNAGEAITISGNNFAVSLSDNTIKFGPVSTTPTGGDTFTLHVRVPTTIPGMPPLGSTEQKACDVVVITPQGGSSDALSMNVKAPLPTAPPTITGISPASAKTGTTVTITGQNFNAGPNTVTFGTVKLDNITGTTTQISVPVPPGVAPTNVLVVVNVTVTAGGRVSDPFSYLVTG